MSEQRGPLKLIARCYRRVLLFIFFLTASFHTSLRSVKSVHAVNWVCCCERIAPCLRMWETSGDDKRKITHQAPQLLLACEIERAQFIFTSLISFYYFIFHFKKSPSWSISCSLCYTSFRASGMRIENLNLWWLNKRA